MAISGLSVTWLGHSTFLLKSPGGRRILMDPWTESNPMCPAEFKASVGPLDLILVSHGHFDHVQDAARLAKETGATVVGIFELCAWLASKGVTTTSGMNKGGTQVQSGISITMVDARHSSSIADDDTLTYLGEAAGFVIGFENGLKAYFAGDTSVFGDMALIRELYAPSVAFLPIGDYFTMDPAAAAKATALLGVKTVVPMHYGTFPILTGRPEQLRELVGRFGVEVIELQPGTEYRA